MFPPPGAWHEAAEAPQISLSAQPPSTLCSGARIYRCTLSRCGPGGAPALPVLVIRGALAASGLDQDGSGGVCLRVTAPPGPGNEAACRGLIALQATRSALLAAVGAEVASPRSPAGPNAVVLRNRRRSAVHGLLCPRLPVDWANPAGRGFPASGPEAFAGELLDLVVSLEYVWVGSRGRAGAPVTLHYLAAECAPPLGPRLPAPCEAEGEAEGAGEGAGEDGSRARMLVCRPKARERPGRAQAGFGLPSARQPPRMLISSEQLGAARLRLRPRPGTERTPAG